MATTSAIGKMAADAQERLAAAMERLGDALGVPPLDLAGVRYRDGAYEAAARLATLAEWAAGLAERVSTPVTDDLTSDRLAVLRVVLERELRAKTKAELEQFALDYGLALGGGLRKDEMVTALAEQLTGKRLDVVPAAEMPDEAGETLAVLAYPPLPDLGEGQVLRISDIED